MKFQPLLDNFVSWARERPDIRSVFVVGSHARADSEYAADEYSDVDLLIFGTQPNFYLDTAGWLKHVGTVWMTNANTSGKSEPQRRAIFEGGLVLDFLFYSVGYLENLLHNQLVHRSFCRGVRTLLDKDNMAHRVIPPDFTPPALRPPSKNEFLENVLSFRYLCLFIAKQLMRGELWVVKARDNNMKDYILKMIEWHTRAVKGWETDTWHGGRYMEKWAAPWISEAVPRLFAHFDKQDSSRALFESMDFYRRLATETAQRLNYPYDHEPDQEITQWVKDCLV